MTAVAELRIAADPARVGTHRCAVRRWRRRGRSRATPLRRNHPTFKPGVEGIVAWGLDGLPSDDAPVDIDGLSTYLADAPTGDTTNTLDVVSFDHVVVMTSSLERTCGAIEAATGEALKRVREAGPVRQGFHRLGPVIVEVVESDRVTATDVVVLGASAQRRRHPRDLWRARPGRRVPCRRPPCSPAG